MRLVGLRGEDFGAGAGKRSGGTGWLSYRQLQDLEARKVFRGSDWMLGAQEQYQPASVDLRLGEKMWELKSGFLPRAGRRVEEELRELGAKEAKSDGDGWVLERGRVYMARLQESVHGLSQGMLGVANPRSSTGRTDVFVRLVTDGFPYFDELPRGYTGFLYLEITTQSFRVRVRKGTRLAQLRVRRGNPKPTIKDHREMGKHVQGGLAQEGGASSGASVLLSADVERMWEARAGVEEPLDMDVQGKYRVEDYWEEKRSLGGRGVLEAGKFYLATSRELVRVPQDRAARLEAYDPLMGEFRAHYAGFFDPGFGLVEPTRVVFELRAHHASFTLWEGQKLGRLVYERMSETPKKKRLYGTKLDGAERASYQGQRRPFSRHFLLD